MGILMNAPVQYKHASLRYFAPNEHHVRRFCEDDVLLLVFAGILRFSENGTEKEVKAGEYYIQKHAMHHDGIIVSDMPQYLYVHFRGEHGSTPDALPLSGQYDINRFRPLMDTLDRLAHNGATQIEQTAVFLQILSLLYAPMTDHSVTAAMAQFLDEHSAEKLTLNCLSERFGYSKNQIILLFRQHYGMTPVAFIRDLRIRKAKHLMESTSNSLQSIADQCGFYDYSQFYKAFCKEASVSPAVWRSRIRRTPIR